MPDAQHYQIQGYSGVEAAAALGLNVSKLKRCYGHGYFRGDNPLHASRGEALRAHVESMSPPDAVDHLLDMVDQMRPRYVTQIRDHYPEISAYEVRLLDALISADNRAPTHEMLYNALYFDRLDADWPAENTVRVLQTLLRKKLRAMNVPVEIAPVHGEGHRLIRNGFKFPWE